MSMSKQGNENQNEKTWQDEIKEIKKLLKQMIKVMNNIATGINRLPDRMVEELYGKETVNWGSLVIRSRMQEEGYKTEDKETDRKR